MSILRRALFMAAKRAAVDPWVQEKAQKVLREGVMPRAQEFGERTRRKVEKAQRRIKMAARDLERKLTDARDDD
ncbi:MAG: hypothetical protein EVA87_14190 [Rhodospirillaceae bacterium]|nr:MAG: hypothetical protein EVA87_14190 [Rhodospirillaceae bacterium]